MSIGNRLNAGLFEAALVVSLGAAVWADDHDAVRDDPLKVVTQSLYVGGDILLPLFVPPDDLWLSDHGGAVTRLLLRTPT